MSFFSGVTFGVFGLGKAGKSTVELLLREGAEVFAWDDNEATRFQVPRLALLKPDAWPWERIETLVLAPGIPLFFPKPHPVVGMAQHAGAEIICDVELLYRLAPEATYIGITGTNGKSTTTALTGHILKEAGLQVEVGGNIGRAASSLPLMGKGGVYVLELSSYQLDLINTAHFRIAALLNITPDHLDRHGDMAGYVSAKLQLFYLQRAGDKAIIAVDDDYTQGIACDFKGLQAEIIPVSMDTPPQGISETAFRRLPGKHNVQNMVVAYNIARAVGVPHEKILAAIASFEGLDHRLQLVAETRTIRFINDSKATNAVATEQALKAFIGVTPPPTPPANARGESHLYLLLGGMAKEGGITSLEPYFSGITHAFLFGAAAGDFAATLEGKTPYTLCGTLENAFAKATALAEMEGGGVVLLSPACASFDQFKSYEHRGQVFAELAKDWVAVKA